MSRAAREFAEDPCSSVKRGNMVRAARSLLSAVTRLLILADMVDVHRLLKSLQVVSKLQYCSLIVVETFFVYSLLFVSCKRGKLAKGIRKSLKRSV